MEAIMAATAATMDDRSCGGTEGSSGDEDAV